MTGRLEFQGQTPSLPAAILDAERLLKGPLGASCSGLRRGFRGVGAAPKRSWIDAVGIERKHSVVELTSGRRLPAKTHEVVDVAPRLDNVTRRVVGIERAMANDDGARIERLDLVDRR